MQIFDIRLTSTDPNVPAEIMQDVRYRKGFEMFDEVFVCHKNTKYEKLKTVSHYGSGLAIVHETTYKDALTEAKRLLSMHCKSRQDLVVLLENYAKDHGLEKIYINP